MNPPQKRDILWRIHMLTWRIHLGTWRIHEKQRNTPCLLMNKPKKMHFWSTFEMSKRGNLLFMWEEVAYS